MRNIAKKHSIQADKSWGDLYYHVIPELINRLDLKSGIELGVAFGGHAESILEKTKIEKLYGVDYYMESTNSTDNFYWESVPYNQNDYDNMFNFTSNRLLKFGDRFSLIRDKTDSALGRITGDLDFVFIDALHTYEGVLNDLETWYDKIRSGGLISGHDYNHPNFPGVTKAVDEFVLSKKVDLIECDGHVWYFMKH